MARRKKRKPAERQRYTRIHERVIRKIMDDLTFSGTKVYLYLSLHCNFARGITHRTRYADIANYCKISIRSVHRGLAELADHNLFHITDAGDFVGILPDMGLIQQYSHARRHEKNIEDFCDELMETIANLNEGRKQSISEQRVYEKVRTERARERKFYPNIDNYRQFKEKYSDYLTSNVPTADALIDEIDDFDQDG